jgi:hypothetical protein
MTLPSFLAASINCGVIAVAGGAAARTRVEVARPPAATAAEPLRISRLDIVDLRIVAILRSILITLHWWFGVIGVLA